MFAFVTLFASSESDLPTWLGLALIPLLILINGYFVAAEFAIVAIRRTRVEELVNAGTPRSKALLDAVTEMDRSVAAAQLGITVASLALGLVSEPALNNLISPLFANAPAAWQGTVSHLISVALTLTVVTYMHVVFGEQMPKIAALQSSEKIGLLVATPLNLFARLTMPVIRVMNGSSMVFLRWLGFKATDGHGEIYTVDELRLLIEDTEEAGLIEPEAADYVLNVFALSNKTVRDIMVPREKVAGLELRTPPDKIMELVRDGAHTRMPVYADSWDNVVGVVNTKDLFYLFSLKGVVILDDALYAAQFLDPDQPVSVALRLFRKSRRPMAIVREKGGTVVGILTLEDVIEEIVGDIEDEHDDPARRAAFARAVKRTAATLPGVKKK
jgi:putative hemolysin